ncbi:PTS system galactitol-specific IIA component [Anaerosolibacter carboniphilus]|uniref:PTS system galactitol-specific IIA component n=1 Tax=Anaerosolibacter carboniphilus TaxID=1417629 RepID=A0A841KUN6_9FIRM|nr:PTS sugar transporter subunit IIA [Anaerosolibacter carboniphilus]MBB6217414.1 PTS system galactitol-specific IIA component [Anaerosolibacter carboniphilus]
MSGAEHMATTAFVMDERLICTGLEADNVKDALGILADNLQKYDFVKPSFKKAVQEREKKFPTGLPTMSIGVAIPHTDAEHVNIPAISIGILKKPVAFQMMGMPENTVMVEIIFMMAIRQSHAQLDMLQKLMGIIQKEDVLMKMKQCEDPAQVAAIFLELME